MRSILSMFSKSPFKPLGSHMDKVRACVGQIDPLFKALDREDYDEVGKISELIVCDVFDIRDNPAEYVHRLKHDSNHDLVDMTLIRY